MKTTNMNNTAIEATASEFIYVATKVITEVWEERTEMDITAFECTSMAAIAEMYAYNNESGYVVTNLATGEESTCDSDAIREWCATQTLDNLPNYRIADTMVWDGGMFLGKGVITKEVSFRRIKRSDIPREIEHPLWLLEVYNADNHEMVACNWHETPSAMLSWAAKRYIDWRYTETGIVNHTFYANGIDITKYYYAKDRKRYTLSIPYWATEHIKITIDTYQYPSLVKSGKKKFICSICGKEHFAEDGKFLPHPVRPNKDNNGRYNHCCVACYEKYVGPMRACRWELSRLWVEIKELDYVRHTRWTDDIFYNLTISEMDSIIKQAKLREKAMYMLRYYEPNKEADKVGIQLRNRAQDRRWKTQEAAKLAEQKTK